MVNKPARFRPRLDLSKYLNGRQICNYGICFDGTLAVVTKSDIDRVVLWRFDDKLVQTIDLPVADAWAAQFLPNASVLVKTSMSSAEIFSNDGELLHSLSLGDFSDVQVSAEGQIWACYEDMAVLGAGCPGLCSVDKEGTMLWSLTPESELCKRVGSIYDCYAMNVCEDAVWATYYENFPVIRVDKSGEVSVWKNEFPGAFAIAAHGNRVLLYGGYAEDKGRCVVQKLGSDGLLHDPVFYLVELPVKLAPDLFRSRGRAVHLVADSIWYCLSLEELD